MKPEEIRQKREESGWSRQELAEKIDAPASGIYKWEKGHSRPSKKNLKRLEDDFLMVQQIPGREMTLKKFNIYDREFQIWKTLLRLRMILFRSLRNF